MKSSSDCFPLGGWAMVLLWSDHRKTALVLGTHLDCIFCFPHCNFVFTLAIKDLTFPSVQQIGMVATRNLPIMIKLYKHEIFSLSGGHQPRTTVWANKSSGNIYNAGRFGNHWHWSTSWFHWGLRLLLQGIHGLCLLQASSTVAPWTLHLSLKTFPWKSSVKWPQSLLRATAAQCLFQGKHLTSCRDQSA